MNNLSFNDLLDYAKTHYISQEDWSKLVDATNDFDRKQSKENRENQKKEYMRNLHNLYLNDTQFRDWCFWLKEICDYKDYELSNLAKYPKASKSLYPDTPVDEYFLPCYVSKGYFDEGNPFYYIDIQKIIIYIRSDWDEYICGESSGEESFAAFWVSNFDTLVIPEFFVNSEYLEDESVDLYHNSSYIKCYKRNLAFNITLWNKDSLIERYNDAISEELV